MLGSDADTYLLCAECFPFYSDCLSHIPINEIVGKHKSNKTMRDDLEEAKENRSAGRVPFVRENVDREVTNEIVVSRTVTIMNDAEWTK